MLSFLHPSEIREAEENPREITDDRFEALKHAMTADPKMMLARPIIVDAKQGDVVAGNMRLRAAKELGWASVPVYVKEFASQAQRREWMLRDNQEYGNWVPDELSKLVLQHEADGADLSLLGFSTQELADLKSLQDSNHDLPATGDAGVDNLVTVWGIVIDCEEEDQQQELLEEFAERGLKCRALMV
jgi:ParB-like chromosome segregation protein Spo0J